jgi:hypothetical protein
MSMRKYGFFQILGAAISTIGVMFLIMDGLSCLDVIPMEGAGLGLATVSLLMATNGYLIMLFGILNNKMNATAKATA